MTRTIHFTENLQASPQILMSEPQKTISTRNKLDFQSHINTDQYTCGFESCELSFSRQSDLVRHKVSIHGPKASCTSQKCGYTTSQADKPNQHQLDGYISFGVSLISGSLKTLLKEPQNETIHVKCALRRKKVSRACNSSHLQPLLF
jgi:hypothetical protein